MFQVATHPSSFGRGHGLSIQIPSHHHHHQQQQRSGVQLPRTLSRPAFTEVSRDAIISSAPELVNVPAEYIRRGLRPKAQSMLSGISSISSSHLPSSLPKHQVPSSLTLPIRHNAHPGLTLPTHLLAIASSSKSSTNEPVLLFPMHSIVLASQCSSFPRLPSSLHSTHSNSTIKLPVLPFTLPSPTAFRLIHSYLYTHALESVLLALLPVPTSFAHTGLAHHTVLSTLASPSALHQLSTYVVQAYGGDMQRVFGCAGHVKELWQDMVALGLNDPELWDTLDLAWEVVLGALNLAAAAAQREMEM